MRTLLFIGLTAGLFAQTPLPSPSGGGGGLPGTGTVTSITLAGTPNEITVIGTCTVTTTGTCTFSVPSDFRLPGTINRLTLTQPATGSTVTIVDGKTFTVSKTLTLTGTDNVTITFPASDATVATLGLTNTFTGRQDATGAASTASIKTGTSLPATCIVGDLYFKSDATAGQNIYECQSTNTWTQQLNSGAGGASTALDNLSAVNINTSLLAQTGADLGSATKPFRDVFIFGAGTYSTTYQRLTGTPTGTRVITLPDATDTLVGKATTDTLTHKTYDTAGTGNSFSINGTAITAVSGTGAVCLASGSACSGSASSVFTGSTATAPSFSATPTFSLADVSVKSPIFIRPGVMTANVTSVTFTNKTAGARFYIAWTQDNSGAHTKSEGASSTGTCSVDPAANATTIQGYVVEADGSTVTGTGCQVTSAIIYGPEQAAPGTPASATGVCWWDSTSHQFTCMDNNSSTKGVAVVPQTCSGQFFSAVAATGVFTCGTAGGGGGNQSRSILGGSGLTPDTSGNVQFQPYSCASGCLSSTAFFAYNVAVFADTSTLDCLYFNFPVPADYSSSATTVVFDWNTTATTGNAIWTFAYRDVSTATLAATTAQESLSVTTAASGTTIARTTSSMTLTGANLAAGDTVQAQACRNGAGSDTIAASLALHDVRLNYVSTY